MSHLCYWNASRPVGLTANSAGSSSSPGLNSAAWDLTYLPNFFLAWAVVHFLKTKLISLWSFLLPTQRTFSAFKTYFPTSGDLRGYTELCADILMREGVKGRKRTLKPSEQCSCPPSKCCGSTHLISRNFSVPLHTLQTSCAGYWCFRIPTSASLNTDVFPTDLHSWRKEFPSPKICNCGCVSMLHTGIKCFKCPCASGVLPRRIMDKGQGMWGAQKDGQGCWAPVGMRNSCKQCPSLVWDHRKRRLDWRHLWLRYCQDFPVDYPSWVLTLALRRYGEGASSCWHGSATPSSSALDLCKQWRFLRHAAVREHVWGEICVSPEFIICIISWLFGFSLNTLLRKTERMEWSSRLHEIPHN